jgi:hypothetical protein
MEGSHTIKELRGLIFFVTNLYLQYFAIQSFLLIFCAHVINYFSFNIMQFLICCDLCS